VGDDRRLLQREPIVLIVDYDGADDLVGDYNENLSTGGTFIRTQRELEPGTAVQLVLSFPGLVRPIQVDGVVRWARPASRADGEPGIHIDFAEQGGAALDVAIEAIARGDPGVVGKLVRVLVVEDNPHMVRLIREGLASCAGEFGDRVVFDFREASNGREALDVCRAQRFDAAIIDIYLPGLDGASLIRELRADASGSDLPIIAVSAGGTHAENAALAAGADLFLGKPMRLRQVVDSMRAVLDLRPRVSTAKPPRAPSF
jgi:uncharacterized protein (TIGR02266 family)